MLDQQVRGSSDGHEREDVMGHSRQLDRVRSVVTDRFGQLGGEGAENYCETILVRDGCYCGRRFAHEDLRAVWFAEESVVKFSDASGNSLDDVDLNDVDLNAASDADEQAA